jgi:antitoxin VapB
MLGSDGCAASDRLLALRQRQRQRQRQRLPKSVAVGGARPLLLYSLGRQISTEVDMSLNIKDQEAHHLAQALAKATGETMTQAVKEALRERLQRVRSKRRDSNAIAADLLAIGRRCARSVRKRPADHTDFLYDDRGMPR